jgi:cellulose 1,4-beta-cellobiosidase/cellulase
MQVEGNFNSISDAYCKYYNQWNMGGISASMSYGLKKGMVLTMGMAGYPDKPDVWGWLDKEPNGPCPIYSNPNPSITYGNIKYGFIGTTTYLKV